MANLPISQLPTASALTGTEVFAVVQSGTTKQTTLTSINYVPGNNYGLFAQTADSTPITGTDVESSLINGGVGTLSVPANGFQVGDSFKAVLAGILNTANNQTIRIKVKAGSLILLDSGLQSISNIFISTNNKYC